MSNERPILFSAAMVRALLDGTKKQTRRVYKVRKHPDLMCEIAASELARERQDVIDRICPYGQPGDKLWVRETWAEHPDFIGCHRAIYRADPECKYDTERWRPSIHMPRWASRILLEIVSVRVERLQDISEADAIAEGIDKWGEPHPRRGQRWNCRPHAQRFGEGDNVEDAGFTGGAVKDPRDAYRGLWASINGPGSWEANPWVWVVEFKRVTP